MGTDFDVEGLRAKMLEYRPRILAFNGKNAARGFLGRPAAYGVQPEHIDATDLFVLPSTSAAARKYWTFTPWLQLTARLKARA